MKKWLLLEINFIDQKVDDIDVDVYVRHPGRPDRAKRKR